MAITRGGLLQRRPFRRRLTVARTRRCEPRARRIDKFVRRSDKQARQQTSTSIGMAIAVPLGGKDPNGEGLPPWPVISQASAMTMEIGDRTQAIEVVGTAEKPEFWRPYYSRARPPQPPLVAPSTR